VKNVDFGFECARALRYERSGEKILLALRYRGYTRVVERVAAPLSLGFNQAKLLAQCRP
jgi:hypothetical protein